MIDRSPGSALLAVAMLLCSYGVQADVYKCVDAEGVMTFSQVPCQGNPQAIKVDGAGSDRNSEPADCRMAYRFAYQTAQSMQDGATSSEIFDRYGGLDSVSKGTLNLTNFVYGYRASNSMSAQRVAGLAQSMCQSGSLRNVSCEELPITFTDDMGGCDAEPPAPGNRPDDGYPRKPQIESNSMPAGAMVESAARDASPTCRQNLKDQIERLDEQMRRGYTSSQGDALRAQRRQLREQMRRC